MRVSVCERKREREKERGEEGHSNPDLIHIVHGHNQH